MLAAISWCRFPSSTISKNSTTSWPTTAVKIYSVNYVARPARKRIYWKKIARRCFRFLLIRLSHVVSRTANRTVCRWLDSTATTTLFRQNTHIATLQLSVRSTAFASWPTAMWSPNTSATGKRKISTTIQSITSHCSSASRILSILASRLRSGKCQKAFKCSVGDWSRIAVRKAAGNSLKSCGYWKNIRSKNLKRRSNGHWQSTRRPSTWSASYCKRIESDRPRCSSWTAVHTCKTTAFQNLTSSNTTNF